MLELLDTGRLAYKFGKWRGIIYALSGLIPFAVGNFVSKVFTLVPGHPKPPEFWPWVEIGLDCLTLSLLVYGIYRLYRDHVHHDHEFEGDRYRREGW